MGVIGNIPEGTYTRSKKNKRYVLRALAALRKNPALAEDKARLWEIAIDGAGTRHNHQMDVLISL